MSLAVDDSRHAPPTSSAEDKTSVNHGKTLVDLVCPTAPRTGESRAHFPPGTAAGDYRLVEEVGRGAFGTVYRAVHPVIGKEVAIKVLDRSSSRDERLEQRFVTEARAVNRIKHPNIVDIFGFGMLDSGQTFYVMELLSGETLSALLKRVGALHPRAALDVLEPLADALDAAHKAGVVHRDLKPANVFLHRNPNGTVSVKLLDFGVAKMLDLHDSAVTSSGDAIGTPAYMAPEQWDGTPANSASDIYALGVMAFQVLTGQRPFRASGPQELIKAQLFEEPQVASRLNPALPQSVNAPLVRMLAKQPAGRPGSASEAVAALHNALSGADGDFATVAISGAPSQPATPAAALQSQTTASRARIILTPSPRGKGLLLGVGLTLTAVLLAWAFIRRSPAVAPPQSTHAPASVVVAPPSLPPPLATDPLPPPLATDPLPPTEAEASPPPNKVVPDRERALTVTRRPGANATPRKPSGASSELEF